MHAMVNVAVKAARRAGDVMIRHLNQLHRLEVTDKGRNEFVTEVDHRAEQAVIDVIHDFYPDHAILAEERGRQGTHDFEWIIDPLDGTTNFIHGFPVFAVSIAVRHKDQLEHGVVYDPLRQEIFTATRGQGAQLDGRRIRVSQRHRMSESLIATGFPYRHGKDDVDGYLEMLRAVMSESAGIRRPGSAALDLSYLAAGRVDGFWELGLNIWDIAAGALLIREAGGRISDLEGGDTYLEHGSVVAGNPKIYAAISRILAPIARKLKNSGTQSSSEAVR